jgi:hypothetical protein
MDKRFLNKVVDQILSETTMGNKTREDSIWRKIFVPFSFTPIFLSSFLPGPLSTSPFPPLYILFTQHCEEIYGLNKDEAEYVWYEYIKVVRDGVDDYVFSTT